MSLRLLIRNSQFLTDLKALRKLDDPYGYKYARVSQGHMEEAFKATEEFDPNKLGTLAMKFPADSATPIRSYWDFLKKWHLVWLPSKLFIHPSAAWTGSDAVPGDEPLPHTPDDFEKVIETALTEARQDPKFEEMLRPAVTASEPFDEWAEEQVAGWDGTDGVVEVPDRIPRPGTVLNIQADLSYPQDVIEAEIKKAVRKAKDRRRALERQGLLPSRPKRLRLGASKFQLKVYDLAKAGKTFQAIHVATNRPVPTCKSAFLAASKKIAALVIPALAPPPVSKNSLPLIDFDHKKHVSQCSQCRSANRIEDMCEVVNRYAKRDHVSQHERLGLGTAQAVSDPDSTD